MNERKSNMRQLRKDRHVTGQYHSMTQDDELTIATQQPARSEKNSLLLTQILSGLVWNG